VSSIVAEGKVRPRTLKQLEPEASKSRRWCGSDHTTLVTINAKPGEQGEGSNDQESWVDGQHIKSGEGQVVCESVDTDASDLREREQERVVSDKRGERGQPCLTPLLMSIQSSSERPKHGETLTSAREALTKEMTQAGKPVLSSTWRAH
jgi:hypothetical protein